MRLRSRHSVFGTFFLSAPGSRTCSVGVLFFFSPERPSSACDVEDAPTASGALGFGTSEGPRESRPRNVEMTGATLTIMKLDDELTRLIDAEAVSPGLVVRKEA